MAFNILFIAGHGAGDVGAQGKVGKYAGILECNKTRELVALMQKEAEATYENVNAYVYPTDRNAFYDCQKGIFKQILWQYFPGVEFDYVFEDHFNAFNISAYGTECFVVPEEKGITVEQYVMKRMGKHFTLRDNDNIFDGVKRTRFLVINTVKQQLGISGALLETCFIDNVDDMDVYEAKKHEIAKDIVAGIAEGWGLKKKTGETVTIPETKPVTVIPSQNSTGYKAGDVVTLLNKKDIIYYGADYGKKIPDSVKGKKYTVQQPSSDGSCLLLKELYSWVLAADCSKGSVGTTNTKPAAMTKKLYLPASATSWNVYPLNKAPIVGNECGKLNPSLFGGLTYDILDNPQSNIVTIQTRDFGKVNIYVGSETGAVIK